MTRESNMTNNPPANGSIWPTITIVLAVITLAVAGWAVVLQGKERSLQHDVKELSKRVDALEGENKALTSKVAAATPPPADSSAARRRRRAAAAAATQATTGPASAPARAPGTPDK
jgi:hypothetical protein